MSGVMAVVLAAGKSTRMKSETPKVLHPVCGRPMIEYVLDSARAAGADKLVVVVGHRSDLVRAALQGHTDVIFAEQTEQKGTGHAVMMCEDALASHTGAVLILAGDTPLLKGSSLRALLERREQTGAACHEGYQSCFFRSIEGDGAAWKVTEPQLQTPDAIYGKQ